MTKGIIISAPFTGSGKTTIALGLLRAFSRSGVRVSPAKVGPDYIDPQFHNAAAERASVNIDAWAMRPAFLNRLIQRGAQDADLVIIEGVMGLFDGAFRAGHNGIGSTADIARLTGWPVILVVDCSRINQSVAALIQGYQQFDPSIHVSGVILNNVAGERHRAMIDGALDCAGVKTLGAVPRTTDISLPSRHLGLVQAEELAALENILDRLGDLMSETVDLKTLRALASPMQLSGGSDTPINQLRPPGQCVAIAADQAFRFSYSHILQGWREAGAELHFFSPLADEAPHPDSDAIYLPGGYPELHGGTLAEARSFKAGLRAAAAFGVPIFGECGGYMVLGRGLVDKAGETHEMCGLLGLETSFNAPRLTIGYRQLYAKTDFSLGGKGDTFRAHEFHHAVVTSEEGDPLFTDLDTQKQCGLTAGPVSGSFMHIIDVDED